MPTDLTDFTSATIFSDDSQESIPQPRDTPLESSTRPEKSTLNGGSTLDDLFSKSSAPKTDEAEETEAPEGTESAEPEKTADTKPSDGKPITEPKKPADDAKKTAETAPAKPAVEEPKDKLAEVQLPPHAKPATVKSFNEVKARARTEISGLQAKIKDLETKIPAAGKLPADIEKELGELRAFRKVHDFQNDTEFKTQFVAPLEANNTSILSKLTANGYTPEQIAKVKEIGIDKLDWDPVLGGLPPAARRSIEALLLDNERITEKKAQAVDAAKTNPQDYAAKQQKAEQERTSAEENTVKQVVESTLAQVPWFKAQEIPANATAEQKVEIEARNAFHKEQNGRLQLLLSDKSPEMRGQMVVATLLAYQKQAEANEFKAKYEKANAELAKIKKSSSTRSSRVAPAPGEIPAPKAGLLVSGREALDGYRNQLNNE